MNHHPFPSLSATQQAVTRLIADGLTDKQIAAELGFESADGVTYHINRIATLWNLDRGRSLRIQIAVRYAKAA